MTVLLFITLKSNDFQKIQYITSATDFLCFIGIIKVIGMHICVNITKKSGNVDY